MTDVGGFLLTRRHRMLLRAALADPATAREAWSAWRRETDLDRLDAGALRLLPLAFRNLGEELGDDAFDRWVRGIVRTSWLKGQSLLVEARPALAELARVGIPCLIGKGGATVRFYPTGFSTRPMLDLDIIVPAERRVEGWRRLRERGFVPYGDRDANEHEILERVSWNFRSDRGAELDLHWHALPAVPHPGADRMVWEAARPGILADLEVLFPAPRHLLFQTLLHVAEWEAAPHLIWVADLLMLVRAESEAGLNWEQLVADARALRLEAIVGEGLRTVSREFGAPVPAEVLRSLASTPRWQQAERRALGRVAAERDRGARRVVEPRARHSP